MCTVLSRAVSAGAAVVAVVTPSTPHLLLVLPLLLQRSPPTAVPTPATAKATTTMRTLWSFPVHGAAEAAAKVLHPSLWPRLDPRQGAPPAAGGRVGRHRRRRNRRQQGPRRRSIATATPWSASGCLAPLPSPTGETSQRFQLFLLFEGACKYGIKKYKKYQQKLFFPN